MQHCDVLLVHITTSAGEPDSVFFGVPFSSGGLTVRRVMEIERQHQEKNFMGGFCKVLSSEYLNEMFLKDKDVERILTRKEMKAILDGEDL